ncbi:hypothetical protein F4780DRAFT_756307 [Xylariomycetidae sp. FL0641]|nr:hypothetical protein F4780DRAFT_756307 [Xylariomycetidae sp. FL0641]
MSSHPVSTKPAVKHVAIVGGGVSGIACSWKLKDHDVTADMYEASDRLGGHANSVPFESNGQRVDVDTGFIAMNEATYPQFTAFLKEIGIRTIPTDMSFGVSADNGTFERGSSSVTGFVGSLFNLLRPFYWRLIFDIFRFNLSARHALRGQDRTGKGTTDSAEKCSKADAFQSIGEYLVAEGYSKQFISLFLIPMVASSRTFPAKPLIHFM